MVSIKEKIKLGEKCGLLFTGYDNDAGEPKFMGLDKNRDEYYNFLDKLEVQKESEIQDR